MTASVTEHYATHLAPIYAWMVGDFAAACDSAALLYDELGVASGPGGDLAIDLGCGHGVHSVALARRGYRVLSIDTSQLLLDELRERSSQVLPIDMVRDDLCSFAAHLNDTAPSLVVCMGDTLPHLGSLEEVASLVRNVVSHLRRGGMFVVSFRDYVSATLDGNDRFIPVRADDSRVHTCFLDYKNDKVIVHDIIHTRTGDNWNMSVSSYPKLRLCIDQLLTTSDTAGLTLHKRTMCRGMVSLAFTKSD